MLTQEEVKRYAHARRLKLIDQIWKDYLQDVLLYLLYRKMPKMVFRGGTCIWKVLKGDRFSEDLDCCVTSLPENIMEYLKKEFEMLGITCSILKQKRTANMFFVKFGFWLSVHPREIVISLEILVKEKCGKVNTAMLYSPYPDVPPIEAIIPSKEEMLIDKVLAILLRNKPRDVHDLYQLLNLGAVVDKKTLLKKIPKFNKELFKKKIFENRKTWNSLKPLIVTKLPSLEDEAKYILAHFEEL